MDDPIGGIGLIFGGIAAVGMFLPPVAVIFTIASLAFGAWSYFGWGGYDPCNA